MKLYYEDEERVYCDQEYYDNIPEETKFTDERYFFIVDNIFEVPDEFVNGNILLGEDQHTISAYIALKLKRILQKLCQEN